MTARIVRVPGVVDISGLYRVEPEVAEYAIRGLQQIVQAIKRLDSCVDPRPFQDLAAFLSASHLEPKTGP